MVDLGVFLVRTQLSEINELECKSFGGFIIILIFVPKLLKGKTTQCISYVDNFAPKIIDSKLLHY